ncbi:[FeFe] hydrogenase H-cluster maturation GTPase HydF [Pseudobutyrivibrio xylanivorans]|uniref:[FeFe] hydrogenase H-cluster maturation GTPase HydF n=1 Tax=Pseudobutyrivibrio xylanivorans DSM 14809 TaxID=1123012 RepID=A0A1M6G030_PSEXY|nr:[FeFe] hydrogenase H-cluster maturation GTPase HydF [Pseudobutyrivibrio xylanivorans]SHJ03300.1 [FeFe] hydrogenase H-cluster maturation GTPase HydF [Pseudobutyrivibrio xylanivorans DSM 14809]
MSLNNTASGQRVHIGFFGIRNAGKSSIVNKLTNQEISLVSAHKGTTTDPVKKAMEILPIGPVVIIDTAGFDDEGELGELRKHRTYRILDEIDIVVMVLDAREKELSEEEADFLKNVKERKVPYIIIENHTDEAEAHGYSGLEEENLIYVDATSDDMSKVKEALIKLLPDMKEPVLVADLVEPKSTVVLVIPIDESAPKGRVILPQQMVLRDLLDNNCKILCCQPEELAEALEEDKNISLVITDSQAFEEVSKIVPEDTVLTSFSILMARYKGSLNTQLEGVAALKKLEDGDKVLISEACTHHRQCNDIGTVKMPGWVKKYTGKEIDFEFSSGNDFPEDLSKYKLVIHCGGCMINGAEMQNRVKHCKSQGVPVVNYGMAIAEFNGILDRSLKVIN